MTEMTDLSHYYTPQRQPLLDTTDTSILDWLERMHTLHVTVEMLYVVDGYRVSINYDDLPVKNLEWRGPNLRDALRQAMLAQPDAPGRLQSSRT